MIPVVGQRGLATTRLEDLAEHADLVTRRVCHHADLEHLVGSAYLASATGLQHDFAVAFDGAEDWHHGVRRAVNGLLTTAAQDPHRARLSYVEILNGSSRLRDLRLLIRRRSAQLWARKYSAARAGRWPTLAHFEIVNGSIVQHIAGAAMTDSTDRLPDLLDPILGFVDPP